MKFTMLCCCLFLQLGLSAHAQDGLSRYEKQRENYRKMVNTKYVLLPHMGTFFLPYVHNSLTHEDIYGGVKGTNPDVKDNYYKNNEAELQVSFLIPIEKEILGSKLDLNLAYTHHAWWQLYNKDWSRPFREANYMPEIFARQILPKIGSFAGFDFMGFDVGISHQSNGQNQLLSRSWNRAFGRTYLQNNGYLVFLSAWYRLPEPKKDDDNPAITNYMGVGSIDVQKSFGRHAISVSAPLFSHHFSPEIKYSFPWKDRLRWYASVQFGYGHSMIEYNRPTERYGFGLSIDSIFTQSQADAAPIKPLPATPSPAPAPEPQAEPSPATESDSPSGH